MKTKFKNIAELATWVETENVDTSRLLIELDNDVTYFIYGGEILEIEEVSLKEVYANLFPGACVRWV